MYILVVTLISTIGVYHPITLKGDPPVPYNSYGECVEAGEKVTDWLEQDHMKVIVECQPYDKEETS